MKYLLSLIICSCLYLPTYGECPAFNTPYEFYDWDKHTLTFKDNGMFKHFDDNTICNHIKYTFTTFSKYRVKLINDNTYTAINAFNILNLDDNEIVSVIRYTTGLSNADSSENSIELLRNQSTDNNCVYKVIHPIYSINQNIVGLRTLIFNIPISEKSCVIL